MADRSAKSNCCDRALAGLFLLIVFLPAGLAILPWKSGSPPLTEKRQLAQRPAIPRSIESLTSFPQEFSRYFDDHFPLRPQLIQGYNYLRVKLMKHSDQRIVLMGRDGWLFNTHERLLRDFIGKAAFTEDKLNALQGLLEARRNWLAARGIAYIFVIPPNKQTVYPEYMPVNYQRVRGRTRMDRFMDHMRARSDVTIVDLRPRLLAARSLDRLYFKHDTHWNEIGALIGYGEVMRTVARLLGIEFHRILTPRDFTIAHRDHRGGDLADMLGLGANFTEKEPYLIPKAGFQPCARKQELKSGLEPIRESGAGLFTMLCQQAQIDMVMFHDSMAYKMVPYLSEHFRRSTYISKWNYDADTFKAVVTQAQPQIVIDECGERMLYYLETGAAQRPDF